MTIADEIWNRALAEPADELGPGDRALAAMLLVHGLVMNGGVHHALESVDADEWSAAIAGYAYFGCDDVAAFFRGAGNDPMLTAWTDETEMSANERYETLVPNDAHLVARFEDVFRERGDQFAPVAQP